jgi:hypothetical protein
MPDGLKKILKSTLVHFCILTAIEALFFWINGTSYRPSLSYILFSLLGTLLLALVLVIFEKMLSVVFSWLLGPTEYVQIAPLGIRRRIQKRYQSEIEQLRAMGFDPVFDFGQAFPLFRIFLVFPAILILLMWLHREVMGIQDRTKFVSAHPVFVARDKSALAHTFGLGTKFYTAFEDGTLLVSKSFKDRMPGGEGLVKHGKRGTLEETWADHQGRIRAMEAQGKRINRQSGFDFYCSLLRRG